jgi:anti-anti-sigma factor
MEIFEQRQGSQLVLYLKGRLDAITADLLQKKFDQIKDATTDLTIDMSELKYISSAGLRVIIIIMKKMKAVNGKFSIGQMSEDIREIFNMAGLLDVFVQDEKFVIIVKEINGTSITLSLAGILDLKAGMELNNQIQQLENAGFTDFFLDISKAKNRTPEFQSIMSEIQKRITKRGKITCFFS